MGLALDLIKRFEGFRSKPYLCSAGVPTIGYGSTYYLDGVKVTLSDPPITREAAEELAAAIAAEYEAATYKLCPTLLAEPEPRRAAVVSWVYNFGVVRFKAYTFRKRLLARDWEGAAAECRKWIWADGKKNAGLMARREIEAKLIQSGMSSMCS